MWDFPGNEELEHLLANFIEQGEPIGLVGHAVVAAGETAMRLLEWVRTRKRHMENLVETDPSHNSTN